MVPRTNPSALAVSSPAELGLVKRDRTWRRGERRFINASWFGLVMWGVEPVVLMEGRRGTPPNLQTTNPTHQSEGS